MSENNLRPTYAASSADAAKASTISRKYSVFIMLLPERGAFNASFTLARRLTERNIRVNYLGPPEFEAHVQKQGFAYCTLKVREPSEVEIEESKRWRFLQRLQVRNSEAFHWYMDVLRATENLIRSDRPDLVLLDPIMWRFSPQILRCSIPIVGLNTTLASVFDTAIPPVFSNIIPRANLGLIERLRILSGWVVTAYRANENFRIEDLLTRFVFWLISIFGPREYRENRPKSLVMNAGGLSRWGEYGLRLAVPELVMAPREFDFPRVSNWTKRIYIGACVDPLRQDDVFDWGAIQIEKPLVYCSLGTYASVYPHSKRLFIAVLNALKDEPRWQGVVQVGDVLQPGDYEPLPSHIRVVQTLPQLEVLKRADVFITHGGMSSVRESIYYGVPMVVFPCWLDQFGNAARVVYHHLGVRADISKVDATQIKQLLKKVQNASFRASAQGMQKIFRGQESCELGAHWLENFLNDRYRTF